MRALTSEYILSTPKIQLLTPSSVMVRAQMLSELEEIITYRLSADQPEKQDTMRKTWMKR